MPPIHLITLLLAALLLPACDAPSPTTGRRPPTLAGPHWGTTSAAPSANTGLPDGFRGGDVVFAEHARLGLVAVTITSPATTDAASLYQATLAALTARFGTSTQDANGKTATWPASQAGGALVQLDTTPDGRVRVRQSLTQSTDHVTERRVLVP